MSPARHLANLLALGLTLLASGCSAELKGLQRPPPESSGFVAPPGWSFSPGSVVPIHGSDGIVATTDRVASEIGLEILRRGGNALDAAVATHFALAVINPEAGNIGGGGFMLVRLADGTAAALDFREKAPLAATRDMYLDSRGELTGESTTGHLSSGVPGSVAGMWEAHQRFGSIPWPDLVQPAINLADGVVVHERLAESIRAYEERLSRHPATAAALLPGGQPPRVGDRLAQPDLAATLRRIATSGQAGFYEGPTAEMIEAEMGRGNGIVSRADLAGYRAIWREPISFEYRGHTIISMPPASSGGATLAQLLNILEGYDLRALGYHSAEHIHLLVEATKRAYVDRNAYLGDIDFVQAPIDRMISDEYAAERRREIDPDRATPAEQVEAGLGPVALARAALAETEHTTHFSIMDGAGNAVALTTTLNSLYGNAIMVTGAGFLLNNEMDDFAARPGSPNQFGLVQGAANGIEPGKRMLSAMTPTIVLDPNGAVKLVTGTPGGATIITTVAQLISNVIDFGMDAAAATLAPRIHHQHLPDVIRYENGGLFPEVVARLEARGHDVDERPDLSGDAQTILVLTDGTITAVSDPRRGGSALALTGRREVVQ
jgi:gamma-glutamyltranspeptidase/glutathione hydrolase